MKKIVFLFFIFLSSSLLMATDCKKEVAQNLKAELFQEGDVIFISSTSSQSKMLEEATQSHWTHVGIILQNPTSKKLEVYEASAKVKFTSIRDFVNKSRGYQVSLKRLSREACNELKKNESEKIDCEISLNFKSKVEASVKRIYQKPYDIYFANSDTAIYCSELTAIIYKESFAIELGDWVKFREVLGLGENEDWKKLKDDPKKFHVYQTIMKRFDEGKTFTPEMPVVTPISQYNSPLLNLVYECSNF